MNRAFLTLFGAGALSLLVFSTQAQPQGGPHHKPPPEAVEACNEMTSGDACSFQGPNGDDMSGTCFSPDEDKPLACRPEQAGQGQGHHKGPPPEAMEACKALTSGDVCSFEGPQGEMSGTCFSPDADKPLACRPDNPPPRQN